MVKRFNVEKADNGQLIIYNNEGIDDYYHLGNDAKDVKGICDLLNNQDTKIKELESENQKLNSKINRYEEVISKVLKMIQKWKEKDWIAEVCGDKYNDI